VIQLPTDVIDLIRRSPGGAVFLQRAPLTYLFDRLRSDSPLVHDDETSLVRQFRVPTPRLFALAGQVRLSTLASDAAIDRVTAGFQPVQATSSSRFRSNPAFRGSEVLDGDPATAWVPQGRLGQWVRIAFPKRTVGRVFVRAQWFPGRTPITGIRLDFSDGSHVKASPSDLQGGFDLKFEPRETTSLKITVTKVSPGTQAKPGPVGISEVRLTNPHAHVPKPSDRRACYSGTAFTLDGRPFPS